jgi:phytoene synthase
MLALREPAPPIPHASEDGHAARDLAACRQLLASGSKSFAMASWLLPSRLRDAATGLYAFCRVADDLIDLTGKAEAGVELVRMRISQIYRDQPFPHPADRAFARVVRDFGIPRVAVDGLVEGFAWDAQGRDYETLDDVLDYAARVAGTVGVMMSAMMGRPDDRALARAADLGIAMQLTNIVRDIGEDARNGRLYLPRAWLREQGLDIEAWLANPGEHPAIRMAAERLLAESERLYRRAETGIALLPSDCRPAIRAARLIYAEIGRAVLSQRPGRRLRRAIVPRFRKWQLLLGAFRRLPDEAPGRRQPAPPALNAAQFLMVGLPEPAHAAQSLGLAWWDLPGRLITILPIIEKLERSERELALPVDPFRQSSA